MRTIAGVVMWWMVAVEGSETVRYEMCTRMLVWVLMQVMESILM
jgi:hypothetical protein